MRDPLERKYNLAYIISDTLYNSLSTITSNLWWFTKETTKETIKIAIPTLATLYLANKYDLIQVNVKNTPKQPMHTTVRQYYSPSPSREVTT